MSVLAWRQDGSVGPGGDVGGDKQVGESWSVRFLPVAEPADGQYALVDEHWYAELVGRPGPWEYGVVCMTQYLVCTDLDDPGGTEVWSVYTFDPMAFTFTGKEAAQRRAQEMAERSSPEDVGWDGRSPLS